MQLISSIEILVGLLTPAVAITLGVLTLYETTYRRRFEENAALLTGYLDSEADKIKSGIKLPMKPESLQQALNRLATLNTKSRRPDDFLNWRLYQLGILMLLAVFAVCASLDPSFVLANVPIFWWALVILLLLFCMNCAFLYFCLQIDRLIHDESQRQKKLAKPREQA